jgi:hypothetical protein
MFSFPLLYLHGVTNPPIPPRKKHKYSQHYVNYLQVVRKLLVTLHNNLAIRVIHKIYKVILFIQPLL